MGTLHDCLGPNHNVSAKNAGTSSSPITISPIRSNAGDIILSSHVANNYNYSHHFSAHNCHKQLEELKPLKDLNLRKSVLSKSAPTSVFSSPAVSPRSDASPPLFFAPREFHDLDVHRHSKAKLQHSTENSPVHSPGTRNVARNPVKTPKGSLFHFHHTSLSETSNAERPESNSHVNAHPLPLPPGANVMSQPITVPHNVEAPYVSSMKGQWQKGKLIGRGTFGSVFLGTNKETGALCAMKEVDLIPDDPKSAECIKQLEQEIKFLRQRKHPNIVQYYGSEIVDDHFYIYLEYVYPGSINKYVREHCGAITESVVRNFTRHILSGLLYLHSTKTIHRDIKGANLLVDASGVVKLADFGMAKHLTGQSYDLSLKGSPYWMAPEVIKAVMKKSTDPNLALAVDIWSVGCTIIEMLTGRPPWSELTGPQAMFKVLNKTPPIPETLSPEGKDFLNCCFRRNPADRPSAAMLLEHAFVRNSHDQNVAATTHKSCPMNLMNQLQAQRDRSKHKNDFLSISPHTRTGTTYESLPYRGNTVSTWAFT